ncbi:MAG: hypothetical protein CMH53_03605 [Myxococcales bacterium]|nr:hypothetical protein [Myxococcales bacterium]
MPLVIYRSHRTERLARALSRHLSTSTFDPFDTLRVVVGSRGMEQWLRQQFASHNGICAQVRFPFPRQAIDEAIGLSDALYGPEGVVRDQRHLIGLVIKAMRQIRDKAELQQGLSLVNSYIGQSTDASEPVNALELTLATEIAEELDALIRKRPDVASAFVHSEYPEGGWFGALTRELLGDIDPWQVRLQRWQQICCGESCQRGHLHVFGLSALGGDDLTQLGMLAKMPDFVVSLYLLQPSPMSTADEATAAGVFHSLSKELRKGLVNAITISDQEAALALVHEQNHPLLAGFGRLNADSERLLGGIVEALELEVYEHELFDGAGHTDIDDRSQSVLSRLQQGLLQASQLPSLPLMDDDRSVTFHPCFGPTRQVEMLRDLIEHAFASHDGGSPLMPRDVLVMTPDIPTFGPLVEAVFSRHPAIAVQVSDLALQANNPFARALSTLLSIANDRMTLSIAMELMEISVVQAQFGLNDQEVQRAADLLTDAGARWGFDADDRTRAGQPSQHQHTIDFALERLVLGSMCSDEMHVITSGHPTTPHLHAPMARSGLEEGPLIGKIVRVLETIRWHVAEIRKGPRPAQQWLSLCLNALDELTAVGDRQGWLWTQTVDAIEGMLPEIDDVELSFDALQQTIKTQFDRGSGGGRPIAGAVTLCAMEPMRSVPFRVIALLGMDDGAFPRAHIGRAWSPMEGSTRLGEHQRRDVDLHLMIEAVLSARQRLMVLWSGHDPQTGTELPPASPINVLREAVDNAMHADTEHISASDALSFASTLHPWAKDNHTSIGRQYRPEQPLSFEPSLSAAESDNLAKPGLEFGQTPVRETQIDTQSLAKVLQNGARALLRNRVGIRDPWLQTGREDREPFSLGSQHDSLAIELAEQLLVAPATDQQALIQHHFDVANASGYLPHGAAAQSAWQQVTNSAAQFIEARDKVFADCHVTSESAVRSRVQVSRRQGQFGMITSRETRLDQCSMSGSQTKTILWRVIGKKWSDRALGRCWLDLLVFAASRRGDDRIDGLLVSDAKSTIWLKAPTQAKASELLENALEIYDLCHDKPVALFPVASSTLARKLIEVHPWTTGPVESVIDGIIESWATEPDWRRRKLIRDIRTAFVGNSRSSFFDLAEASVRRCFDLEDFDRALPESGPIDPQGWMRMALRVWGEAINAGSKVSSKNLQGFVKASMEAT